MDTLQHYGYPCDKTWLEWSRGASDADKELRAARWAQWDKETHAKWKSASVKATWTSRFNNMQRQYRESGGFSQGTKRAHVECQLRHEDTMWKIGHHSSPVRPEVLQRTMELYAAKLQKEAGSC